MIKDLKCLLEQLERLSSIKKQESGKSSDEYRSGVLWGEGMTYEKVSIALGKILKETEE